MDPQVSGKTKVLGVIGSPVAHSASPRIHNTASQLLGKDIIYVAFEVPAGGGEKALQAMRTLGIAGFSVTMPLKQEVLPYLDEVHPTAQLVGAVNTIVNQNGVLTGYNTDGVGMMRSITAVGTSIHDSTMTLFGTGGAGTAIFVEAALKGAKRVYLYNTSGRLTPHWKKMLKELESQGVSCQVSVHREEEGLLPTHISDSQIIINASPVGMAPNHHSSPLKTADGLTPEHTVADAVYNPLRTRLLAQAQQAGAKWVNGHGMLLHQGAEAYRLFTGEAMPVDKVRRALDPEAGKCTSF